jgi:hypothetical protein
MGKVRLKDEIKLFPDGLEIRVVGFYSMQEIKDFSDYMNRFILAGDVVIDNNEALLILYIEDEVH